MTSKVRVAIAGALGHMGSTVLALAARDPQISVTGALERANHPKIGMDLADLLGVPALRVKLDGRVGAVLEGCDVLIDFTNPQAALEHLERAARAGRALVVGTTGFDSRANGIFRKAARRISIVKAPNMSAGVNLLYGLAARAAEVLGPGYDVEIVEVHHRRKKDAPSGTALELAKRVADARKVDARGAVQCGRSAVSGPRRAGAIGIHAVRGGDVVGEHTVCFMSDGERVELTHRAASREAFAAGAVLAAKFAAARKKGLFSMEDVLGVDPRRRS